MPRSYRKLSITKTSVVVAVALLLLASACGSEDDGAGVRDLGAVDGSDSASASASAVSGSESSGSSSAPADGGATAAVDGDGGYEYASNVDSHRLLVADLCGIGDLLDAGDFAAVEAIYSEGGNSVNSDGSVRTIAGFAESGERLHGLATYYGTPAPLDDFVTGALTGTDLFDGESDGVRAQGVEKGMQNQVMVAWTVHELNTAVDKAKEGDFDAGAVHNWDEGWAFFHGREPGCGPISTGDKRAANFGTLAADGETALANEAILAAMISGRDALRAGDAAGAKAAADEVVRNLVITYSQAAVRYASLIEDDLAAEDDRSAEEHQAEGLAFWRVIEAYVAPVGADFDTVNAIFDLGQEPGANG
ncbi:MAG: FEA1-related lipoprotein, partial [Acidimicrobiales bacterium]